MKLSLKNEVLWGWVIVGLSAVFQTAFAFYPAFSKNNVLGIVNIHQRAAYAYEGSYMWLFINPIAVILFYLLFVRLVYKKTTTAKKIKPLMMFTALGLIVISTSLTALLILNS